MRSGPARQRKAENAELAVLRDLFMSNYPGLTVSFPYNGGNKLRVEAPQRASIIRVSQAQTLWARIEPGSAGYFLGRFPHEVRENMSGLIERLCLNPNFCLPDPLVFEYPIIGEGSRGTTCLLRGDEWPDLPILTRGSTYGVAPTPNSWVALASRPLMADFGKACAHLRRKPHMRAFLYPE